MLFNGGRLHAADYPGPGPDVTNGGSVASQAAGTCQGVTSQAEAGPEADGRAKTNGKGVPQSARDPLPKRRVLKVVDYPVQ